jgi:hypothetical protein
LASGKILALRATNVALSRDLIAFADDEDITKSAFFHLPAIVEQVIGHPEDFHLWEEQRASCEAQLQTVNQLLAERGSSANLIFRVRLLRSLLGRLQQVISLERPDSDARKLAVTVVHGFASQRRLSTVMSASTRRLARSVVERTGRAGKHYIAQSAGQWGGMGLGAILAGVITAFTALFKYSLAAMIHAPLLLALAHSLNYVVSFLLMQAGGFLLASKMPAVTAATLVDAMEDPEKDHMVSLQAISQTQFIVTISNLLGAVPASIAMDRIINAVRGHPFLTESALVIFAGHGVDGELPRAPPDGLGHRKQPADSCPAWAQTGGTAGKLGEASCPGLGGIHRAGISSGCRTHRFRIVWNTSRSPARDFGGCKSGLCSGCRRTLRTTALAGGNPGVFGYRDGWHIEYRHVFCVELPSGRAGTQYWRGTIPAFFA